jgi:hypothetical protein
MDRDWSSHVRMSNFSTSLPIDSYHVYVYTWEVANCADPIIYTSTPNTDLFYVNTTWNLTAQFAFLGNVPRGIGLMADAVLKRYAVPLLIVPLLEYRLWCEGFWKYKEWPILSGILVVQEGFSNTVSVFHLLVLCSLFFLGALLLLLLAFVSFLAMLFHQHNSSHCSDTVLQWWIFGYWGLHCWYTHFTLHGIFMH